VYSLQSDLAAEAGQTGQATPGSSDVFWVKSVMTSPDGGGLPPRRPAVSA